uniref:BTB domain-containing protein n=1 Tax=Tetradesmus obliquus TaxID=3088 RepID=A0A383VQI5_TETOB|eukprot:jgi/Sobl393_1/9076/SZX66666.1
MMPSCVQGRLHSPVLAQALDLATSSSSTRSTRSSSSDPAPKELHIPCTSKADFLTVAQFLYPIVPLPKVSWETLEVLLVQGHKWDMQVVLGHAGEFLQANASSLDLSGSSNNNSSTSTSSITKYAFEWLQLADAAGLSDACKACADRIIELDRSSCKADTLANLSRQTLMYMVERVAATPSTTVNRRCASCSRHGTIHLKCSYCGYNN